MITPDDWRVYLYPLGFLSIVFFGARFVIQWIQSERVHRSLTPPIFWQLSLIGNLLLFIHSFIQVQFHVSVIQACSAVISWRNLNLMQKKKPPYQLSIVLMIFFFAIVFTVGAFIIQNEFIDPNQSWFRIPRASWQTHTPVTTSILWNLMGATAYFIFSLRFWVQWWLAEKAQRSELPLSFWWLSLSGGILSIIYFYHIGDSVNLISLTAGMVPYIRNIMLIYQQNNKLKNT